MCSQSIFSPWEGFFFFWTKPDICCLESSNTIYFLICGCCSAPSITNGPTEAAAKQFPVSRSYSLTWRKIASQQERPKKERNKSKNSTAVTARVPTDGNHQDNFIRSRPPRPRFPLPPRDRESGRTKVKSPDGCLRGESARGCCSVCRKMN